MTLFAFPGTLAACEAMPARPVINVSISEVPVKFDLSQTIADLNKVELDTVSPYPSGYHTEVGGVMSSQIDLQYKIRFNRDEKASRRCVQMTQVEIKITAMPRIFIANDYQEQACRFKGIFEHEVKHVMADRALLKEYEGRFVDAMNLILMTPEDYSSGWLYDLSFDAQEADLKLVIEHALTVMFRNMMEERQRVQQEIDNIEEYTRISSECRSS